MAKQRIVNEVLDTETNVVFGTFDFFDEKEEAETCRKNNQEDYPNANVITRVRYV